MPQITILPQSGSLAIPLEYFLPEDHCPIPSHLPYPNTCEKGRENEKSLFQIFQRFGYVERKCDYEVQAAKIESGDLREQVLKKAYKKYLQNADSTEYLSERALYLHQAKVVLGEIGKKDQEQEQIAFEEALSCQGAAHRAQTTSERVLWLIRGIREIEFHFSECDALGSGIAECQFDRYMELTVNLWSEAGELLVSEKGAVDFSIIKSLEKLMREEVISLNDAGAKCYRNAALVLLKSPDKNSAGRAVSLFEKSMELQKKESLRLTQFERSHFQYEVAKNYRDFFYLIDDFFDPPNVDILDKKERIRERSLSETLEAKNLYDRLVKNPPQGMTSAYFLILKSKQFESAALLASSMKEKAYYYARARDVAKEAWDSYPSFCLVSKEFTINLGSLRGNLFEEYVHLADFYEKLAEEATCEKEGLFGTFFWNKIDSLWDWFVHNPSE